ncbi:MAG: hypothetical protein U1F56_18850 [Rubrivivax sp.]
MDLPASVPAPAPAPVVMLLSLWCSARGPWRARLVDSEARVHEFDSPFELARHLCTVAVPAAPAGPGLR